MAEQDLSNQFSELRKQAEQAIKDQPSNSAASAPEDTVTIIHDLRVHQIELELQNEELRATQRELQLSRHKYADLYEFSPVGLLTLDEQETIQEANLTFASLMGIERENLISRNLSDFIDSQSQDTYHFFFQNLRKSPQLQQCEIILQLPHQGILPVKLEGISLTQAGIQPTYRVAISDRSEQHQAELEQARLYAAEQAALIRAEHLTQRLLILQQLTATLSEAVTPRQVVEVIIHHLPPLVLASSVWIGLLTEDQQMLEVQTLIPAQSDTNHTRQFLSLADSTPLSEAVRSQHVIWLSDLQGSSVQYPQLKLAENIQAMVCIPLSVKERQLGGIEIRFAQPQVFSDEQKNFTLAMTGQSALALDRAQLAQQIAATKERQWLAAELHDSVTQAIFTASILAQTLPQLWERNPNQATDQTALLSTITQAALAEMRNLLLELRPEAILRSSIQLLLKQLGAAIHSRMKIEVVVELDESPLPLPADVHFALYRIAQESINNVIKYSHATQLRIALHYPLDQVTLLIEDNGQGFDIQQQTAGLGQITMRERAQAIGAALTIDSALGKGTRIHVVWKSTP